ncbi:MAG: hypothetical protein R3E52_12790 [Burkholderiaceae bacterium]
MLNILHKSQVMSVEKDENNESTAWRLDSVDGIRSDDNFYAKYMAVLTARCRSCERGFVQALVPRRQRFTILLGWRGPCGGGASTHLKGLYAFRGSGNGGFHCTRAARARHMW